MRVVWSNRAYNNLFEILTYFADIDEEELGHKIINNLYMATDILADFPMVGRIGRINGTRELINKTFSYITIYEITSTFRIDILTVIHTSRLFPEEI
jgi:plasmid stabilization system protein ParE